MVYVPENLSAEEKETMEKLRDKPGMQASDAEKKRIFSKLRHIFD